MEIGVLDTGINRFQNTNSLLQPFFYLAELRSLWTLTALLIASLAAFSGIARRVSRLLILRLIGVRKEVASHSSFICSDDDWSFSSDDDEDGADETEEDELLMSDDEGLDNCYEEEEDEYQGHNNVKFQGCAFWPQLNGGGGAVVKLWDGLGLTIDRAAASCFSLFDLSSSQIVRSFSSSNLDDAAAFMPLPAMLLSAVQSRGAMAVRAWDFRVPGDSPVVSDSVWQPGLRAVGIASGNGGAAAVYVKDDCGAVTEVDLRSARRRLAETSETWWDADAVFVEYEGEDGGHFTSATARR